MTTHTETQIWLAHVEKQNAVFQQAHGLGFSVHTILGPIVTEVEFGVQVIEDGVSRTRALRYRLKDVRLGEWIDLATPASRKWVDEPVSGTLDAVAAWLAAEQIRQNRQNI